MTINSYFDKVFCINLERRTDRLQRARAETARYGIQFERWPGVEVAKDRKRLTAEHQAKLAAYGSTLAGCPPELRPYGTMGTTLAHRQLLRYVAEGGPWKRVLVLEDDFQVITAADKPNWFGGELPDDFQVRFDHLTRSVPDDWDVLYLGGGYGNSPLRRVNDHCIRVDRMLTTSSYGITREYARLWTDRVDEGERSSKGYTGLYSVNLGTIDMILSVWAKEFKHYAVQPRLIIQAADYSDATQRDESYIGSMTDEQHERQV